MQAPSGLIPTIARYDLSELDNSFDDAAFSDMWREAMEAYERTTKTSLGDPVIYKAGSINDLVQVGGRMPKHTYFLGTAYKCVG